MNGWLVVDGEVRVVHPDARRADFAARTEEPVRQAIYDHPALPQALRLWGVDALLESMDRCGIRYGILSGLAWNDRAILADNNAYVRECLESHRDRFRGLYTPDTSDPQRAADAILGLDERLYAGVEVIPKWQRTHADDPRLDPIVEAVRERGFLMKVYTAHPTQTLDGDAPYRTLRFLRRHPEVRTLIPHLGGLLCLYALHPPVREALRNAWFVTSVSSTMKMVEFAAQVNPDNLVFGTDFPFNHCFDQKTPLDEMFGLALPEAARRRILGGTAAALLGLDDAGQAG